MRNSAEERETLKRLVEWGEQQDAVRALILTSTRAVPDTVPGATLDILSDYDVILILTDIHRFAESRAWLAAFGRVLTLYCDPVLLEDGFERSGSVVQFEGGLKIDFTLMPVEMLGWIAAQPTLPDEFDAGYRVLLDKDRLTVGLKPPTYQAYIPKPPTEAQYREQIEDFFLVAIYVAKYLWRGDLIAAKHLMDSMMLHEHLLPMLEWQVEIAHQLGGENAAVRARLEAVAQPRPLGGTGSHLHRRGRGLELGGAVHDDRAVSQGGGRSRRGAGLCLSG